MVLDRFIRRILNRIVNYNINDLLVYLWLSCIRYITEKHYTFMFYLKSKFYGVNYAGSGSIYGKVNLVREPYSVISIGKNISIVSSAWRASASSVFAPVKLMTHSRSSAIEIGDNVGLNGTSIVSRSRKIIIGTGTIIASNVTILDFDGHALWPPENRMSSPAIEFDQDVIIGKNVWIGTRAIILKGVTIGDNSVIGAGSVVVKNIPENVVAVGNPAKVVKQLGSTVIQGSD